MYKQTFLFFFTKLITYAGFLKRNFKENQGISKKNHGSFVIKEIFKKEGILKPGNFFQKKTYNPKTFLKKPKKHMSFKTLNYYKMCTKMFQKL